MYERLAEELKRRLIKEQEEEEFALKVAEDIKKDRLYEMSEVTRKNDIMIHVFGKEGYIQHFHISMKDGRKTCLQFKENAYFLHGKYKDTLTNKELDKIKEMLQQPSDDIPNITNWQMCIVLWNRNNNFKGKVLELGLKMPNYHNPKIEK